MITNNVTLNKNDNKNDNKINDNKQFSNDLSIAIL